MRAYILIISWRAYAAHATYLVSTFSAVSISALLTSVSEVLDKHIKLRRSSCFSFHWASFRLGSLYYSI
jgi:hypothetical protein